MDGLGSVCTTLSESVLHPGGASSQRAVALLQGLPGSAGT